MLGVTDLVKCFYQGILAMQLERNVQVDGRTGRWMTVVFPLLRNDVSWLVSASSQCHPNA